MDVFPDAPSRRFFVYSGMVEIFLPESAVPASNKTSAGVEILAQLNSGCYFGDVALVLEHSPKRSASARVSRQGVCTLYTVNKEDVLAFFHDYPVLLSHVMAVAGKRLARVHHKRGLLAHLPEEFKIDDEDAKADEHTEALGCRATPRVPAACPAVLCMARRASGRCPSPTRPCRTTSLTQRPWRRPTT